ncbi:SOS response-associated peptidase family protein [Oscillospiraceae bacterium NSJ-54]|uniref:SOS response-associated peptidase family protein n=1 Tax=Zongyangia hominis TaxID=2763677 RepID=A0A926EC20_9FIRM|nr:SOS response-associated peptidase family protein [Zongyangia hominis]
MKRHCSHIEYSFSIFIPPHLTSCFIIVFDRTRFLILASTEANASVRDIHHRMPVVLPEEKIPAWIEDTGAA